MTEVVVRQNVHAGNLAHITARAQWASHRGRVTLSHCAFVPAATLAATVSSNTRQVTRRSRPIQEMPPPIRWEKVGTVALIVTRATTTLRHIGLLTSDSNPASPNWTWSHLAPATTQLCPRPINFFPVFVLKLHRL